MNRVFANIYRMTHIENIPHILQYGITHRFSQNSNPNYRAIGDTSLIDFRNQKHVIVKGKDINLGDYIPFYFGVRMPMLYVVQHGGNYVPHPTKARDIVYVVVSIDKILKDGNISFFFSDGHATDYLTKFYTKDDIQQISEILDRKAILARQWSGENIDRDIKRRKQAEFLVKQDIPHEYIVGYVCYNDTAKAKLLAWNIPDEIIRVKPTAYY